MSKFLEKYASNKILAQAMTITPKLAQEMLETSGGNRNMRPKHLKNICGAMQRGEWLFTNQGIGFNNLGRLCDGHHRLLACVQTGISFPAVVVRGLHPSAYEVIDIGAHRSYSDRLGKTKRVTEIWRLGCSIALAADVPTPAQMHPFIDGKFGETAEKLVEYCGGTIRGFSTAPMKLAACVMMMAKPDSKDYVLEQYASLVHMKFDNMSNAAETLVGIAAKDNAYSIQWRTGLARGMFVFDESNAKAKVFRVTDERMVKAVELTRKTLLASIGQ